MRGAAVSGCLAMIIWIWGNLSGNELETRYFRLAAQIQFIHSMTCFGCATFMNLGARTARFAPGSFLIGAFLLCGSLYLSPSYRRSAERRVGEEFVSPGRARWWPEPTKQNNYKRKDRT